MGNGQTSSLWMLLAVTVWSVAPLETPRTRYHIRVNVVDLATLYLVQTMYWTKVYILWIYSVSEGKGCKIALKVGNS
jgi:hypothetical protein